MFGLWRSSDERSNARIGPFFSSVWLVRRMTAGSVGQTKFGEHLKFRIQTSYYKPSLLNFIKRKVCQETRSNRLFGNATWNLYLKQTKPPLNDRMFSLLDLARPVSHRL